MKKIEGRKKLQGKNIMAPLLHRAAITMRGRRIYFPQKSNRHTHADMHLEP